MIFCRYRFNQEICYGILNGEKIQEIRPNPFEEYILVGDEISTSAVQMLTPVVPSKIVAIGLNYKKHAEELHFPIPQEPVVFLKPPSSIIGPEETIVIPKMSAQVEYEGELAVVIGKRAHHISTEQASQHILGYTCFNDVTARDLQKKDSQWTRAKSFDTFSPVGPWIAKDINPLNLKISTVVNGAIKQNSSTQDMIFDVFHLVSYVSQIMTLEPGDVLTTGTPSGIGPLKIQDTVEVRIEGIGTLRNKVL